MSPAAQRAVEWLEQQISDLNEIRNATARDPSFKNWRQATLTVMQRIWAGDQSRIERFRRIPFSPVDPRADARLVRESYSRGCQEAGRVLKTLIDEIQRDGVPDEVRDTNDVAASEFEDGFPTVDLPLGDVTTKDPAAMVADLMGDMGDLPPQGQDPSSPAPPRLQVEVPPPAPTMAERLAMEAAASTPPAPPVVPAAPIAPVTPVADANAASGAPRKGLNMKARLKDLLGFAQLSAKALAGFPRENDPLFEEPTAPRAPVATPPAPSAPVIPAVAVTPAPTPVAPPAAVTPAAPIAIPPADAPTTGAMSQEVSAMLDAWPPKATQERTPEVIGPVGPIEPIAITPPVVAPAAPTAPAAAAPVAPPVAAVTPAPAEPPAVVEPPAPAAMGGSDAGYESPSVIMSRPTTLRANIEKVSIDSLISPEFRESEKSEPVVSEPLAVVEPPVASEPDEVVPVEPPPVTSTDRPALSLVPPAVSPVIDDPEFMIDPTPSASLPKPTAHVPVPGHAVPPAAKADVPPPRIVPVPAPATPAPPAHDAFDDPLEAAMGDVPVSKPDPEAFARAAEDFMKSSPVLGASPRRVTRTPHDEHGFGDPDALAVASIIHDLADMGVPEARYAETRARLLDLARRLERGELDWATLRKAVWFAMEYPDLARRLMPVLLPWMDRAA